MERRDLLKGLGAAAALPVVVVPTPAPAQQVPPRGPVWTGPTGTGSDPDLIRPKVTWPRQLTPDELGSLAVLCDLIIPADDHSPGAASLGVPGFIDEWVSAPHDYQREALGKLRSGLVWLDDESNRRHGRNFTTATERERTAICDDICHQAKAKPEHKDAAAFFDLVRNLTATGFYTTREGMKDIGYVGNVPLQTWEGPPPEVLRHLGL